MYSRDDNTLQEIGVLFLKIIPLFPLLLHHKIRFQPLRIYFMNVFLGVYKNNTPTSPTLTP